MKIVAYIIGIILQIIGTAILLYPAWKLPQSYREYIDASVLAGQPRQRLRDNRILLNVYISGTTLITIGLIIQTYFVVI